MYKKLKWSITMILKIICFRSQAVTMPYPAVTLGMGEMAACIGCIQRSKFFLFTAAYLLDA